MTEYGEDLLSWELPPYLLLVMTLSIIQEVYKSHRRVEVNFMFLHYQYSEVIFIQNNKYFNNNNNIIIFKDFMDNYLKMLRLKDLCNGEIFITYKGPV